MSWFGSRDVREVKKLLWILKRLDTRMVPSVKKLGSEHRVEALKYLIVSKLKELQLDLEKNFIERKKLVTNHHSGIHYLEHRISKLTAKIKLFELDYDKEEFKKIYYLVKTLEKEIEDV